MVHLHRYPRIAIIFKHQCYVSIYLFMYTTYDYDYSHCKSQDLEYPDSPLQSAVAQVLPLHQQRQIPRALAIWRWKSFCDEPIGESRGAFQAGCNQAKVKIWLMDVDGVND